MLYVEGVLLICSNGSVLLNKMAAMPIYGDKHLKIFFSRTKKASRLDFVVEHWGLKVIEVCSNDDPGLDQKSNAFYRISKLILATLTQRYDKNHFISRTRD